MKKTVFSFGEILWDMLPSATILGGAPFNFTYRVHSLGNRGLMISRVGNDELGKQAINAVVSLGLETAFLQTDTQYPTGTVKVFFDENRNPDYYIVPDVAYDHVELTDSLVEAVGQADCFCFGTLSQRSEKSRQTLQRLLESSHQSVKFLDINLRKNCYSMETVTDSLRKADVLKLNDEEARTLSGMLSIPFHDIPRFSEEMIRHWSLTYCLVTLGDRGAFGVSNSGDSIYVPGYHVDVVDSVGSGDAFSAGFVHSLLQGASLAEACESGNMLGAIVATQKGGTQPISAAMLDRFREETIARNCDDDLNQAFGALPRYPK